MGLKNDADGRLNPWYFMAAVMQVFDENESKDNEQDTRKVAADTWAILSLIRHDLFERVRRAWSKLTEEDPALFPHSVDAVAFQYYRIRKRNEVERDGFRDEIRRYLPAKTQQPSMF